MHGKATFIKVNQLRCDSLSQKYQGTSVQVPIAFNGKNEQYNTIYEMVQTNSHRFNTHVKHLSLSASVVIIIITRLLATSRIITQYFNHLLLYSFTTRPLKIDEPLLTFQFCHSWLDF